MKKLCVMIIGLSLALGGILSTAWAGVNYIQEKKNFEARKTEAQPAANEKGEEMFHQSKYKRDEVTEGTTIVPTAEHPKTGQKYERPDWAK